MVNPPIRPPSVSTVSDTVPNYAYIRECYFSFKDTPEFVQSLRQALESLRRGQIPQPSHRDTKGSAGHHQIKSALDEKAPYPTSYYDCVV